MITAPALAECLILNKGDFIRTGARGSIYLAYRRAIQEAVVRQLAAWGDARDADERAQRRAARPVASRSEGYHLALCVAMALAPLVTEPGGFPGFITEFLRRWGKALGKTPASRAQRKHRP